LLERLREPVKRALRDGALRIDALSEIVLVGGATRMPVVRRAVTRMFGRFPSTEINPDEAVAVGAAVLAGLKARDVALKEVVLTDVCPYSLGVATGEKMPDGSLRTDIFSPVIERNTVVPASRVRRFSTLTANQAKVKFNIYQGEARYVSDNLKIGEIEVPIPPKSPVGTPVDCRFTYDINGLIEVDVHVPASGETRQLVILDEESGPSGEELARLRESLAALKTHPREQEVNRSALARGLRCYEASLGDAREFVGQAISRFEAVINRQDPRAIEHARLEFLKSLDAVDGETFF
jgi:molecular chaperone HscC